MKRFKFRLEKVLQFRHMLKDEKLRTLTIRNNELRELEVREKGLGEAWRANLTPSSGTVPISDFVMRAAYSARLKEELSKIAGDIINARKRVEDALQEYIHASKEAKALDTLKDRRKAEHDEYVLKEEERFLDELTIQRRKSSPITSVEGEEI